MNAPAIWMPTITGRCMDLMQPSAAMVDLMGEVPEVLARISRFAGHVPFAPYSVAQHCVLGAEALLRHKGNVLLAQAFLLHDAHEAYIGEITSPVAQALHERTGRALARLTPSVSDQMRRTGKACARSALASLKADLDAAIYTAAGLDWPLPDDIRSEVDFWDLRMLRTERDRLLVKQPHEWNMPNVAVVPLRGRLVPWPWSEAADRYRAALTNLFPHLAPHRAA